MRIDEEVLSPADVAELSTRLSRAATDERARQTVASRAALDLLRQRPRDLVGGSLDPERGSARLVFDGVEVVAATDDLSEFTVLLRAARTVPVRLEFGRSGRDGRIALVFAVGDWTVVAAAQTLALA